MNFSDCLSSVPGSLVCAAIARSFLVNARNPRTRGARAVDALPAYTSAAVAVYPLTWYDGVMVLGELLGGGCAASAGQRAGFLDAVPFPARCPTNFMGQ